MSLLSGERKGSTFGWALLQIVMCELYENSPKAVGLIRALVSVWWARFRYILGFMCCCHNFIMNGHMFCVPFLSVFKSCVQKLVLVYILVNIFDKKGLITVSFGEPDVLMVDFLCSF